MQIIELSPVTGLDLGRLLHHCRGAVILIVMMIVTGTWHHEGGPWCHASRVTSLSRIQSSHAGERFRPKLSQTAAKVLLTIPELYKFLLNFRILAFVFHN